MDRKRIALHLLDATPEDNTTSGSLFLAGMACGMLVMFLISLVVS